MTILAFDTATTFGAVAAVSGGEVRSTPRAGDLLAVVDGLLTRTYFRNSADAVKRAGVATSHIYELGERLSVQAKELARRGRPVESHGQPIEVPARPDRR